MDYLERASKISAVASLSEKETDLFLSLTNPLFEKKYDFVELYNLFSKLIEKNQGNKACELYKEKQQHYESEPSSYPELQDDVQIG